MILKVLYKFKSHRSGFLEGGGCLRRELHSLFNDIVVAFQKHQ